MTSAMLSKVRWRISDTLASPQVWKAVGECRTGTPPVMQKPLVKVSHLLSEAEEYIGGLRDGEEIELTGNFIVTDTGQLELQTAADAEAPDDQRYFECALLDGTGAAVRTITFIGIVLSWGEPAAVGDALMFTARVKVNSNPVRVDA